MDTGWPNSWGVLWNSSFYYKLWITWCSCFVVCNIVTQIPAFGVIVFQRKPYITASFDESVLGWTSFLGFNLDSWLVTVLISFLFNICIIKPKWRKCFRYNFPTLHNSLWFFYNFSSKSSVTLVLNSNPSVVKNFKT